MLHSPCVPSLKIHRTSLCSIVRSEQMSFFLRVCTVGSECYVKLLSNVLIDNATHSFHMDSTNLQTASQGASK